MEKTAEIAPNHNISRDQFIVRFREYDAQGEETYSEDVPYSTLKEAQAAQFNFLTEYTDHLGFE